MLLSPLSFPGNEGGLKQAIRQSKPGPVGHSPTRLQFVLTTGSPKQDPGVREFLVKGGNRLQKKKTSPRFPRSFLDAASSFSCKGGAVVTTMVTADTHRVPFTHGRHSPKSCR